MGFGNAFDISVFRAGVVVVMTDVLIGDAPVTATNSPQIPAKPDRTEAQTRLVNATHAQPTVIWAHV